MFSSWEYRCLLIYNNYVWLLLIYFRILIVSVSFGLLVSFTDRYQVGVTRFHIPQGDCSALLLFVICSPYYYLWYYSLLALEIDYIMFLSWSHGLNCCMAWIFIDLSWSIVGMLASSLYRGFFLGPLQSRATLVNTSTCSGLSKMATDVNDCCLAIGVFTRFPNFSLACDPF